MNPPTAQELERWEKILDGYLMATPWRYDAAGQSVRAVDDQLTVCDIRGWGYLTGEKGITEELATRIQDDTGLFIVAASEGFHRAISYIRELEAEASDRMKPCRWEVDATGNAKFGCGDFWIRYHVISGLKSPYPPKCPNCGRPVEVVE